MNFRFVCFHIRRRPCGFLLNRQVSSISQHNHKRVDEFAWIQADSSFIHLQNEVVDDTLRMPNLVKWSSDLCNDLENFRPASQMPVELIGDYYYFSEYATDSGAPVYRRRHRDANQAEEVLNMEALVQEHGGNSGGYCHVGMFRISFDSRYVAYTLDLIGNEMYVVYIKEIKSGQIVEKIENAVSIEWVEHSSQPLLAYTTGNLEFRASEVRLRALGGFDRLVFAEPDSRFQVDLALTKDRSYLLVKTSSKTSSEVRFLPALSALQPLVLVELRKSDVEYFIEHSNGNFIMVTNENAPNNMVLTSPVGKLHWKILVPHEKFTVIHEFDVFQDHLVLYQRHKALPQLSVVTLSDGNLDAIPLPHSVGELTPGLNSNSRASAVRFNFSNPVFPTTTFDYEFASRSLKTVQADFYKNAANTDFVCDRYFVSSSDPKVREPGDPESNWVPLTVVHSKACKWPSPVLFQTYGAYGMSLNLAFDPLRYSLLQQGWTLAFCHARGGGELGAAWHRAGSLARKMQTFQDIISCVNHLISQGFTSPSLLTGWGASAGGTALAAVANMRPELFKALVLKAPAVDLLGSMLDKDLSITNLDTLEWGDPITSAKDFDYLLQYSPYDNVRLSTSFPSIYVTAGLYDLRVNWWEPAKYVAKLLKTYASAANPPLILLRTKIDGGHAQSLTEDVEAYTFLRHMIDK